MAGYISKLQCRFTGKCSHILMRCFQLRNLRYISNENRYLAVSSERLNSTSHCHLIQSKRWLCILSNGIPLPAAYMKQRSYGMKYISRYYLAGSLTPVNRLGLMTYASASSSQSSCRRLVHKDISPLTSKRVTRRTKIKDPVPRNQVFYEVTALTTADEYNLEALIHDVEKNGYNIIQLPQDEFDALHIEGLNHGADEPKRIFFFREGSAVFWNVPDHEQITWLENIRQHQDGSYDTSLISDEKETLEYTYTQNKSQLTSGDIELRSANTPADLSLQQLDMFAFSNALSLSVKLAVWEAMLAEYVDSIEWVLQDLKDGKKIRMSEADVLRKAGELFTLSHLINLSSDLLDTPDFYWDREELEKLYSKTCNYLSIARRTKVMNEKLGQCVELTELLRDHLKDKHHTRLEVMIIVLIAVEVGFAIFHLFERHFLTKDKRSLKDVDE